MDAWYGSTLSAWSTSSHTSPPSRSGDSGSSPPASSFSRAERSKCTPSALRRAVIEIRSPLVTPPVPSRPRTKLACCQTWAVEDAASYGRASWGPLQSPSGAELQLFLTPMSHSVHHTTQSARPPAATSTSQAASRNVSSFPGSAPSAALRSRVRAVQGAESARCSYLWSAMARRPHRRRLLNARRSTPHSALTSASPTWLRCLSLSLWMRTARTRTAAGRTAAPGRSSGRADSTSHIISAVTLLAVSAAPTMRRSALRGIPPDAPTWMLRSGPATAETRSARPLAPATEASSICRRRLGCTEVTRPTPMRATAVANTPGAPACNTCRDSNP
mmetsp:Transcript_68909/g.217900  ORF Transcript_68909/g.217900 Transcript_68909/m.217900 type:complete len:332 (+) Transcript_68909:513-1508(+)